MLSSKIFVVWFVALLVTYSCCSAPPTNKAVGKTFIKQYYFPGMNIWFDRMSYNETHLVYGLCSDNDFEKNCKLTLDDWNSTGKSLSCDVTIKVSDKGTRFISPPSIAILNNDRALFLSQGMKGQKVKLTNVNFRSCSTNEVEIEIEDNIYYLLLSVLAYDNSYDVFFANSKLCQKRSCRITFDNDGKVVKNATAWGSDFDEDAKLGFMYTVAPHSPAKGFIVESRCFPFLAVAYAIVANNEGKQTLNIKVNKDDSDVTISMIGNYIGTCISTLVDAPAPLEVLRTLECKQFDFEGNLVKTELQVNTSSLIGDKKRIYYMTRLNLVNGFILFTVLCPVESRLHDCSVLEKSDESYALYHIDRNGKFKVIDITDFKGDVGGINLIRHHREFVNDAGQRCFSVGGEMINRVLISELCFTDDEL